MNQPLIAVKYGVRLALSRRNYRTVVSNLFQEYAPAEARSGDGSSPTIHFCNSVVERYPVYDGKLLRKRGWLLGRWFESNQKWLSMQIHPPPFHGVLGMWLFFEFCTRRERIHRPTLIWAAGIMGLHRPCTSLIGVRFPGGPPKMAQ